MDPGAAPRYPFRHEKRRHLSLSTVPAASFRLSCAAATDPKSDGYAVGAVSGFCNMLWKLVLDAATPMSASCDAFFQ
jgi:hypothetical protein